MTTLPFDVNVLAVGADRMVYARDGLHAAQISTGTETDDGGGTGYEFPRGPSPSTESYGLFVVEAPGEWHSASVSTRGRA